RPGGGGPWLAGFRWGGRQESGRRAVPGEGGLGGLVGISSKSSPRVLACRVRGSAPIGVGPTTRRSGLGRPSGPAGSSAWTARTREDYLFFLGKYSGVAPAAQSVWYAAGPSGKMSPRRGWPVPNAWTRPRGGAGRRHPGMAGDTSEPAPSGPRRPARPLAAFLVRGGVTGLLAALGLHVGYVLGGTNFRTVLPGEVYRCAQ